LLSFLKPLSVPRFVASSNTAPYAPGKGYDATQFAKEWQFFQTVVLFNALIVLSILIDLKQQALNPKKSS
jgi:hypothetical protein